MRGAAQRAVKPAQLFAVLVLVVATAGLTGCGSPTAASRASQTHDKVRHRATAAVPPVSTTTTNCTNGSQIAAWPLSEKLARLIVVPSEDFDVAQLSGVIARGVGGVLFLGSSPAPSSLAGEIAAVQSHPVLGVPVLTMADEEGGGIQRLTGVVDPFPWPRDMAATESVAQVTATATRVGRQMRAAGVDVDLAPVLDVDGGQGPDDTDPDGSRSFSADPSVTTSYGVAFMRGLQVGGVIPVVKHFPGLGGSSGNSDDGPATTQALGGEQRIGLPPFAAAIASGAPAVMVANDTVPGLTTGPASLSPAAITGLLRTDMGFTGAVLTDSLSAGAVASAGYTVPEAAVSAIEAGADLVLFGSTLTPQLEAQLAPQAVAATVDAIVAALTAAVTSGALTITEVDAAVGRVVTLQRANLCG
jgi:beta-N-acetylhexosaminidase